MDQRSTIEGVATGYSPARPGGGLFESPAAHVLKGLYIGRVVTVSLGDGTHRVTVATKKHRGTIDAKVLMPFVDPTGRGLLAGIRKNTLCLVAVTDEGEFFVIGFYSPAPANLYEGPAVHQGDVHLASSGDAVVSVLASGDVDIRAHDLCAISLFQEDQRLTVVDRTFEARHAAGTEVWEEATEDTEEHSEGDTWRAVEVRRKRGDAVAYKERVGNVRGGSDGATELVSERAILNAAGEEVLLEELETDGSITIRHPNGARFRMDANGDVFVEPKTGGGIYLNDSNKVAQGAARIGDSTQGHNHQTAITRAGPFVATVEVITNTDSIAEGSSTVKVG